MNQQTEVIESFSAEETYALGEKIGQEAKPGQVYTLIGDLGVGKTVFTQGVRSRAWHNGAGQQPYVYHRADL